MYKIEQLPKSILVDNEPYSLSLHVTVWNKLCLCYKKMFPSKDISDSFKSTIFSQVVESDMTAKPEFSECIYDIVDVPNFNEAVDMMIVRINDAICHNKITLYR